MALVPLDRNQVTGFRQVIARQQMLLDLDALKASFGQPHVDDKAAGRLAGSRASVEVLIDRDDRAFGRSPRSPDIGPVTALPVAG